MDGSNPEEYFPELNIHLLKMQAERWIKKFSEAPIKRVLLYNFSSKYEGTIIALHGLKPNLTIYAIVFDLDVYDKRMSMSTEAHMHYDLEGIRGERQQESYERLLAATKSNCTIAENEQYHDFMTRDFAKVYKTPPNSDYRKEWKFYCNFKNTSLSASLRTDEPHIILWQQDWGAKMQEWADEARKTEHIDILKLCHLLAYDVESSSALPALWRKYHMDKRGPSIPETETFEKRVGAWFRLMQRLTTGFDGVPDQRGVPYLKTCKFDPNKGVYVEASKDEGTHANLQALKKYFTDILLIPTPLPALLFQTAGKKRGENPNHISEMHRQARERCRIIAREIIKERPDIDTIQEIIFDDRMTEAATKENNEMYAEKSIKGWIKDIVPPRARRPGRRPKK